MTQLFSGLQIKKVSVNTFFQFALRLSGSMSTLLITLLLTYVIGLQAVGSFTKVVTFVSIFFLFVDFGLNSVAIKCYFKSFDKQFANLIVLRLGIAFVLLPIIGILAFVLPHNNLAGTGFSNVEKGAVYIYAFSLVTLALNNSIQALLQRKLNYSLLFIPSLISNFVLLSVSLYAVLIGNFYLLFFSYILSGTVLASLSYFKLKQKFNINLQLHKFIHFSKSILLLAWPLGVLLIINLLYARADIVILSFLRPSEDVGIYGVSYRFFEVALALPTFLANSTFPILMKAAENSKKYDMLFKKYLKLYILISFILSISIFAFSQFITIMGNKFGNSILPLNILSTSLPFFFATSLLQWHFLIKNKIKFLVPLYLFAFIINIFLNIVFVPQFSYIASAIITVVSEGIVFVALLWYFYQSKKA